MIEFRRALIIAAVLVALVPFVAVIGTPIEQATPTTTTTLVYACAATPGFTTLTDTSLDDCETP